MNWNWDRYVGKCHVHIFAANLYTHEFALFFFLTVFLGTLVTICYLLRSMLSQVHMGHCSELSHCFTPALALIISFDDLHVHSFFLLFIQSAMNFIQPNFILYFSVLEFLFI